MIRTKAALPDKAVLALFREVDCVMDDSQTQAKLVSPCISVCQMDVEKGLCLGCYRTRAEIAAWRSLDQDDQLGLLDILRDRRAKATGVARRPSRRNVKRLSV